MTGTSRNLTDQLRFREATALYLNIAGLDDATARPMRRKVSEGIGETTADVTGVDGWFLATSSRASFRIGGDLDAAHAEASDGKHVALVQHRRERPLGDSLVCMTLSTFAAITAPSP
ncbi:MULTISPECIES: hypothetical protein [Microbacterium]|uniref:hypothetical protein n=1 Tax=Microbacterium TaxID=33882 RepID=UPI0028ED2CAA|nr:MULTISPECIES: hypothetical protein [Microbacterium]